QAVRVFGWGSDAQKEQMIAKLQSAKEVTIGIAVGRIAAHLHDFPDAARVAQVLIQPQRTADWRAAGHIILAEIALARGHWNDARTELARAEPLERDWSIELRALYSTLPFVPGTDAE